MGAKYFCAQIKNINGTGLSRPFYIPASHAEQCAVPTQSKPKHIILDISVKRNIYRHLKDDQKRPMKRNQPAKKVAKKTIEKSKNDHGTQLIENYELLIGTTFKNQFLLVRFF